MRFMMIIKDVAGAGPTPELFEKVGAYRDKMLKKGILVGDGGLTPPEQGARIDLRNGELVVHDGPFSEAKEVIGGFAILKVGSKAEAIQHGRDFLQLHIDTLGRAFSCAMEVRQLHDDGESC